MTPCHSAAHYLSKTFLLMVSLLLILVNTSRKADAQYTPLSFAYNDEVQTSSYVINGSTYPTGTLSLGAVDFVIPSGQNNYWNAALVSGSNPITLTIPVGLAHVDEADLLINTGWGQSGPNSYASLTFTYSDGTSFTENLVGNSDIRDYNNGSWTNSINGTTTTNVWDNGSGQRMDKVQVLPASSFVGKTLSNITVTDNGGSNFQRVLVWGATVHQVQPDYVPVPFAYNQEWQTSGNINAPTFPAGNLTMEGVPFSIPVGAEDTWNAAIVSGSNPLTLTIPVNMANIDEIDTLINTVWGQPGPNSYASLTFTYSDGTSFTENLVGNSDIRDYNNGSWTNSINGTTTVNVWTNAAVGGNQRLDKQQILPTSSFVPKTLSSITVTDNGGSNFQRVSLFGLTVHSSVAEKVSAIAPTSKDAGGPKFTLVVKGSGFALGDTVTWNGAALTTTFVSTSELKATVPAADIAMAGTAQVAVMNSAGNASNAKTFTILQTTLKVASASAVRNGDGSLTVTVTLSNTGYLAADNTMVTKSTLHGKAATNLPASAGNIAAKGAGTVKLNFPGSAGTSGQVEALAVSGTFTGGTFKGSLKVTLP